MTDKNDTSSPQGAPQGKGRGDLFSRDALSRLGNLNRERLKDQLTTADQLSSPADRGGRGPAGQGGGEPARNAASPGASDRADLASLCPGQVVDGPHGALYLIEDPVSAAVPEAVEFEAAYHRTFVGGGMSVTVESLHRSVRPLAETPVERIGYLDIETCGMAGMPVFLVGLLVWQDGGAVLRQFLARDYAEERSMLEAAWRAVDELEVLVTFNGASFDVPFMIDRAAATGLPVPELRGHHVDLLHEARRRWKGSLPNCRLQTLERFICGRLRSGDIPGHLIPGVYHEFVSTGDARQMAVVLRHNNRDLVTLAELAACVLSGSDGEWL